MANSEKRQMHLNYFHRGSGHHDGAWRLPDCDSFHQLTLDHLVTTAKLTEGACFDSVFLAHGFASFHGRVDIADPLLMLMAMAAHTSHVGLIGTMSTTYTKPYDLAQRFSTLDHISGGRAGWNIVTSSNTAEANRLGLDTVADHDTRYRRAAEYVDVARALWDSWESDAVAADKEAGVLVDPSKIHELAHAGEFFAVQGPGQLPRSPQRWPLLVQAGSSRAGRDFAARFADAVFTAQPIFNQAQEFYADMQTRAAQYGRPAGSVKILPGIAPIIGPTETEARRREKELAELMTPERCYSMLEWFTHLDLNGYPLDGPVPVLPEPKDFDGNISRLNIIAEIVRREHPTLRQLAGLIAGGRGHFSFAGTAEQLADKMEEWFENGAADGFNVMPLVLPGGLQDFTREVVPMLQERELFRTEYTGSTLREHYGATVVDQVAAHV